MVSQVSSPKIPERVVSKTLIFNINSISSAIKSIETSLSDTSVKLPSQKVFELIENKKKLTERLAELSKRTDLPVHGSALKNISDIYRTQKDKLEKLLIELQKDPGSPSAMGSFEDLPPRIKAKIYECVWIAHGVPFQENYAEIVLKKDGLGLLLQIKEPLVAQDSGSLIEQMVSCLEGKLTVCGYEEWRDRLNELLSSADNTDKILDQLLPADKIEIENSPKDERAKLIERKRDQYNDLIKECMKNEMDDEVKRFKALILSPHMTHRQLRALFKKLDSEVQQIVPKPPYYGRGVKTDLHEKFGARLTDKGATFTLYAPHAKSVRVAIKDSSDLRVDFDRKPMAKNAEGNWELSWDGIKRGTVYEYIIETKDGKTLIKADPFAIESKLIHNKDRQVFPLMKSDDPWLFSDVHGESVVSAIPDKWNDGAWMKKRAALDVQNSPMNIYEVYPAGWKQVKNYRDLAGPLAQYCKEMGYTHVELMAIIEYQNEKSWGYHPTGFFSVNSRLGNMADFQYLVDHLHQNDIGVILDWIPGHFSPTCYGLGEFDGEAIYEHPSIRKGHHIEWSALIFNYESKFVRDFLISSAFFWLDKVHIDGLRIDAVESMLNLNFYRNNRPNEWIFNRKGGEWNLEAILFLRELNTLIHEKFPGVATIAEDSSSFRAATVPTHVKGEKGKKGLGFDLRWAMGYMNDTLVSTLGAKGGWKEVDPVTKRWEQATHSKDHRGERINALMHAAEGADEPNKVLPFSHDEVSQGKESLLKKMPGDKWQQFANVRLLLSYQMCLPGKKLNFMGNEFGQAEEWSNRLMHVIRDGQKIDLVDWDSRDKDPMHAGVSKAVQAINHLYLKTPALWHHKGKIQWVHVNDSIPGGGAPRNAILGYHRTDGKGSQVVCLHNFTPTYYQEYTVYLNKSDESCDLAKLSSMKEIYNSDHKDFGGSGRINPKIEVLKDEAGKPYAFKCELAPLATMVFEELFTK